MLDKYKKRKGVVQALGKRFGVSGVRAPSSPSSQPLRGKKSMAVKSFPKAAMDKVVKSMTSKKK